MVSSPIRRSTCDESANAPIMTRPTIVWFRHDLRLADNPALAAARMRGHPAIAVFVNPITEDAGRGPGSAASWWLHHSLALLEEQLAGINVPLVLASGEAREVVPRIVRDTGAETVVWNRRYEASAIAVDREIKQTLGKSEIAVSSFNGHLLVEPWQITKRDGEPYRVFTPFWKTMRSKGQPNEPIASPARFPIATCVPTGDRLDDWRLAPSDPDWAAAFPGRWQPGERGAHARLTAFLAGDLKNYAETRDRPDLSATSRLSPHLRFGEISPRLIWHATRARIQTAGLSDAASDKFLSELAWREFSYHLLYHHPDLATAAFQPRFDRFPWQRPRAALVAWQRGRTGYPIVDAGMRELWATGWMHNRVRMVAASFLTKHLRIDWRHGETWFWDTLVDADPANNAASWQWVAGCGADAAPYFRIFNPVLQGETFDPEGAYVRRWVPELVHLPSRWIHRPWQAPAQVLATAGIDLGTTYPRPVVDHAAARAAALEAFRTLRDSTSNL
jgi:deoxyribodipyrimidine photo-lyase